MGLYVFATMKIREPISQLLISSPKHIRYIVVPEPDKILPQNGHKRPAVGSHNILRADLFLKNRRFNDFTPKRSAKQLDDKERGLSLTIFINTTVVFAFHFFVY